MLSGQIRKITANMIHFSRLESEENNLNYIANHATLLQIAVVILKDLNGFLFQKIQFFFF